MKKGFLLFAAIFSATMLFAQIEDPVQWSFSAKKVAAGYEIHLKATVEKGWHIYSQTTPEGGPEPTSIRFNKNPLVTIVGKAKEVGKLEKHFDPIFDVEVKQFSNSVDFVQVVKIKGKAKTKISGSIEYMLCDDSRCLPPSSTPFNISLK